MPRQLRHATAYATMMLTLLIIIFTAFADFRRQLRQGHCCYATSLAFE